MRSSVLATALFVLACSAQSSDAQAAKRTPPSTGGRSSTKSVADPLEQRKLGQQLMNEELRKYGIVSDSASNADVASVLDKLTNVLAQPGLRVKWAISANPEANAKAITGDYMLINAGILSLCDSIARARSKSSGVDVRSLYLGGLAAVIGHELSHLALGHTNPNRRASNASSPSLSPLDTVMRAPQARLATADLRQRESDADRLGSLLILRAGWSIEDAIAFFDEWDRMSSGSMSSDVRSVTYLRSHPRLSQRGAQLESFRAELKLDQRRLDDALTLIRNSVMLTDAIAMLDTVLQHFPDNIAALHARASGYHAQWMVLTVADSLRVQASTPVYPTRYFSGIRGASEQAAARTRALRAARDGYERVNRTHTVPFTLSGLAVLDAYEKRTGMARARADSAIALDSTSVDVRNNHGVVRYLTGDLSGALRSFELAVGLAGQGQASAALLFNLGRTRLATGDRQGAAVALRESIHSDRSSRWAPIAISLLRATGDTRELQLATTFEVPSILGIEIGASARPVGARLGAPSRTTVTAGGVSKLLVWDSLGLAMMSDAAERILAVGAFSRDLGSIDGVQIGDNLQRAFERWGRPTTTTQDRLIWRRDGWFVQVEYQVLDILGIWVAVVR